MSRLIDADALLKNAIIRVEANWELTGKKHPMELIPVQYIIKEPTVDAEPVRHGKWTTCYEDSQHQIVGDKCSVCGFEHYSFGTADYHFCPNCGAKMDGGADSATD